MKKGRLFGFGIATVLAVLALTVSLVLTTTKASAMERHSVQAGPAPPAIHASQSVDKVVSTAPQTQFVNDAFKAAFPDTIGLNPRVATFTGNSMSSTTSSSPVGVITASVVLGDTTRFVVTVSKTPVFSIPGGIDATQAVTTGIGGQDPKAQVLSGLTITATATTGTTAMIVSVGDSTVSRTANTAATTWSSGTDGLFVTVIVLSQVRNTLDQANPIATIDARDILGFRQLRTLSSAATTSATTHGAVSMVPCVLLSVWSLTKEGPPAMIRAVRVTDGSFGAMVRTTTTERAPTAT